MSNICSFSMENTHNNVEFGVLQKTSKQSLILIFFQIGRGKTPFHTHPPLGTSFLDQGLRPCLHKLDPPTQNFLDPPLHRCLLKTTLGVQLLAPSKGAGLTPLGTRVCVTRVLKQRHYINTSGSDLGTKANL